MNEVGVILIWTLLIATLCIHAVSDYIARRNNLFDAFKNAFKLHLGLYALVFIVEPYNIYMLLLATLSTCMAVLQFMEVMKLPLITNIGYHTLRKFSSQTGMLALVLIGLASISKLVGI